jgi:hypothetical protein
VRLPIISLVFSSQSNSYFPPFCPTYSPFLTLNSGSSASVNNISKGKQLLPEKLVKAEPSEEIGIEVDPCRLPAWQPESVQTEDLPEVPGRSPAKDSSSLPPVSDTKPSNRVYSILTRCPLFYTNNIEEINFCYTLQAGLGLYKTQKRSSHAASPTESKYIFPKRKYLTLGSFWFSSPQDFKFQNWNFLHFQKS